MSDTPEHIDEPSFDPDLNDKDVFHIGKRLGTPSIVKYTTERLHVLIHEGEIELCPTYQRDVVWTTKQQSGMLDSIFRDYYVPPLVFAVSPPDEDGMELKTCVDGKQRLSSIQAFIDGLIPYIDPVTKQSWFYTRSPRMAERKQVPEEWKKEFAAKEIICMEYTSLTDFEERDVFQRVQMGKPLEAAEKLQAITSPRANMVRSLDNQYLAPHDGIPLTVSVNLKRGKAFQHLARLALYCDNMPKKTFASHPNLETWLNDPSPVSEEFKVSLEKVLSAMRHIATEDHLCAGFSEITQKVSPAEFVFIGVLLFVLKDTKIKKRAVEIHGMRKYIRKEFRDDIRHRQDIVRKLWEYVETSANDCKVNIDWEVHDSAKRRGKRKARDFEDEEDVKGPSQKRSSGVKVKK
ncbi:hypothetical protein EIP91_007342 [Steccherinum ochraceum]|uniref:GmrSD restriction endonucleases N-terminal domain-containing protein n=1 Tax=Steccherinum ochraceum TaxID=92696 RepID=A0A4R0RXA7_9APHY|nr:hypothetical protein EIP91_007342 [Steccherinum ochraceum]